MKCREFITLPILAVLLALAPTASASNTWYVNGVNGNDSDDCKTPTTPCKTIGHAISLASSGDSIMVAAATYAENLTIGISLNVIGSGASTTIIDGHHAGSVITIYQPGANPHVTLSDITIRNGYAGSGGGIYNNHGTLTINYSVVTGNWVWAALGGGILNTGRLTINNSTVSANLAGLRHPGYGGGIYNFDTGFATINNSTISGNVAFCGYFACGAGAGGGIYNRGGLIINNSTLASNSASGHSVPVADSQGGGIFNVGAGLVISNSTLSGNGAHRGGGIFGGATLQNSIVANSGGGNCDETGGSRGYNVSSDATCGFSGPGDLHNTDPKLGTFGYYGGPTQTIPLLSGSPAIDAGNPSGCTDAQGNVLKTDQRGMPRPDKEDSRGCDIGAYESPKE